MDKAKSFLSDLIREEKGGKASSKKIWGHIIMLLVCASFIIDGLHFYNIDQTLFLYMIVAGCTLIGLKTAKDMLGGLFNKAPKSDKESSDDKK